MKKFILLSLLLAFATASFCQQTIQKQHLTQTDYLQKSKKQKKVAWILLGGGAALIVTSIVIPQGEPTGFQIDPISGGFYEGHKNDGIKSALIITGVVSMLGSIPFFIASGKNKKKARAASVFINMERAPVLQNAMVSNQSFPALGLRISF
jgi:heme/copper-type cytochrome/quinol oxidase subunit 1